jgi:ribosomal protein L40E
MEKVCLKCNAVTTTKWYGGGTLCRSCYRKNLRNNKINLGVKEEPSNWRKNNKVYLAQKHEEWKNNNVEHYEQYQKEYRQENKHKKYALEKEQYETNINFKLTGNLRRRLNIAIKKDIKTGSAIDDLGCSISEFKNHIESKFTSGMNWNNWSRTGWHIDHIKPLASFDLTDPSQLSKACHYSNLQPLWARDNLIKGSKYE